MLVFQFSRIINQTRLTEGASVCVAGCIFKSTATVCGGGKFWKGSWTTASAAGCSSSDTMWSDWAAAVWTERRESLCGWTSLGRPMVRGGGQARGECWETGSSTGPRWRGGGSGSAAGGTVDIDTTADWLAGWFAEEGTERNSVCCDWTVAVVGVVRVCGARGGGELSCGVTRSAMGWTCLWAEELCWMMSWCGVTLWLEGQCSWCLTSVWDWTGVKVAAVETVIRSKHKAFRTVLRCLKRKNRL